MTKLFCKKVCGAAPLLAILVLFLLCSCEQAPPSGDTGGVSVVSDMEQVRRNPGGSYVLSRDITLIGWTPIENFSGTFDGGGHRITFSEGKGGLFASARGAAIRNFTVAGTINAESGEGLGVVVGGIAGSAVRTAIENCVSSVDITAIGHAHNSSAGGIVGTMRDNCTIRSCRASGSITLSTGAGDADGMGDGLMVYAGGITGYSGTGAAGEGASGCLITACSWSGGTVNAESGYPYAGGIAGYNYSGARITECSASGTVRVSGVNLPYAGGITGYNSRNTARPASVENCYSTAAVSAVSTSKQALAGGIAGANAADARIATCYVAGAVTVTVNGSSAAGSGGSIGPRTAASAGGIAGAQYVSAPGIENCAALNSSVRALDSGSGAAWNISRIGGKGDQSSSIGNTDTGVWAGNIAYTGMTLTKGGSMQTAAPGENTNDGADCAAKPLQSVFEGMGWDFAAVWKMGGDGYPALRWQ